MVNNLICEYRKNPLGIDIAAPRFGWQIEGTRQTAYRILTASAPDLLSEGRADVWDSGRVESDQSLHVAYAGPRLNSRQRVYWNVTVWDENDTGSQSESAWFEMGLLRRKDWKARWIGAKLVGGPRSTIPVPYLRKSFTLPAGVESARLYVTALGFYECSLNGQIVGDDVFNPGWTDYHKRVQYKVYDVGGLLRAGENAFGALLGDGWAAGFVGMGNRQKYVDQPRLLAQLEIALDDGRSMTIFTDRTWKHQFGPLVESDIMQGESYDARLEMPGWDSPGFDDKSWLPVQVFEDSGGVLVATNGPTVRRIEELKPAADPVKRGILSCRAGCTIWGRTWLGGCV